MAHAVAHEIADDSRRIVETTPTGTIPFVFVGSLDGSEFMPRTYVARARPFELEADASAARMMLAAGYDPLALFDYLSRIEPRDNERMDALTKSISGLLPPPDSVVVDSSDFRRIQERVTRPPRVRPTIYSPR